MPYTDRFAIQTQTEKLMNVATTLADFTQTLELAAEIPAYLSHMFDLEAITLAIVRENGDTPEFALLRSSGQIATGEAAATFADRILNIHQQTQPRTDAPVLRSPFTTGAPAEKPFAELAAADLPAFPRALVFARAIDDRHRMCLIIHQRSSDSAAIPTLDGLTHVAELLAKLLRCTLAWQDRPELLGAEFEALTNREWVVLRGLNSDDGEKQLADRLGLSPHTLHSHIKAIYRKIGVQGRLQLLLKLTGAVRELRKSTTSTLPPSRPEPKTFTALVG